MESLDAAGDYRPTTLRRATIQANAPTTTTDKTGISPMPMGLRLRRGHRASKAEGVKKMLRRSYSCFSRYCIVGKAKRRGGAIAPDKPGALCSPGFGPPVNVTCALCHSTVDNSIIQGVGKRLDGWPNLDLNVGAIIALSPVVDDKSPYLSWGPGKFDPRFTAFDGRRLIPLNSPTLPVVIPPVYGLQNVGFEIFTGDGPISYWNNYVGVTQMGGHGDFRDDRIGLRIVQRPDMVTPKLPALLAYQLSLQTPAPDSFDVAAADRGEGLFMGKALCSTCHIPPTYTDVMNGPSPVVPLLHAPSETGMEEEYAGRSATHLYRTTPLRALARHPPYFHDGSARSLADVVNHYIAALPLTLSDTEKADLIEFLKSL